MGRPSLPEDASTPGEVHPPDYRDDLNPRFMAGQNYGVLGPHPEKSNWRKTAYDFKGLHRRLQQYPDDELKRIPVMPEGSRLEQGATYIDLASAEPQEFTATGNMQAGPEHCYVPKSEVDYQLWNKLIGVGNPERLGQADEAGAG